MIQVDSRENGVYCIRCKVNDFTYYGSCGHSKGIKHRIYQHLYYLKKGKHPSYLLQRDFSRYGEDAFEVFIIHLCAPEDCLAIEQLYLDMFGVGENFQSYNICPTAGSSLGRKLPQKTKEKISKSNKGKILGIRRSTETRLKMSQSWKGKKKSPQQIEKITLATSSTYVLIDPSKNIQVVKNLRKFCRENDLHQGALVAVAKGKHPHHKHWVAVKVENESPEGFFNAQASALEMWEKQFSKIPIWVLSGPIVGEVITRSLPEICKALGLDYSGLLKVANGQRKHCKNWTCRKIFLAEQINSTLTT